MAQLQLTNIVNISIAAAQTGIGNYNTSNIGLFTRETSSIGAFKIYLEPSEVATDFGSGTTTADMANSIFSQQPNILAGNGYLAVIPFLDTADVTAVQHIAFPTLPASGQFKLTATPGTTAFILFSDNAATVQTRLQALSGYGSVTVAGDFTAGFDVTFTGVSGPVALMTVTSNSLQDATPFDVIPVVTTTTAGTVLSTETLDEAITRTVGLVQYFGILAAEMTSEADGLAAAAVVQPLNKILFLPSSTEADIQSGGYLDLLRTGNFTKSRGLYHGVDDDSAILMSAAYAGRGLSTDFSGSNTTQTMHLKDLIGIQPDTTMTQTILGEAQDAGADVYASFQGVAKTFTSGENHFFDDVYNQEWISGAFQVAIFNALAQSATKLPQTEQGLDILKGAARQVCEQALTNQYVAPGSWTSGTTFGVLSDFLRNIGERGYYIYTLPVALQSSADRAARLAPVMQIAIKEAGAVHKSNVIVFINP